MAILSDTQIRCALEAGQIDIFPFVPEHVRSCSVDLRLGEWFFRPQRVAPRKIFNPFSPAAIEEFYGGPMQALSHREWCEINKHPLFEGIEPNDQIIVLDPYERILVSTEEFLGIEPPGTFRAKCRSSWGRFGIEPWGSTGLGDPGFYGRLSMPVMNMNHTPIVIRVGERVAQVTFHETGPIGQHYGEIGQYRDRRQSREEIRASWKPEMLLPNAPSPAKSLVSGNGHVPLTTAIPQ